MEVGQPRCLAVRKHRRPAQFAACGIGAHSYDSALNVAGVDRVYASFSAMKSAGVVESHGVLLVEHIFQDDFVGPADARFRYDAPDFTLATSSNAIDKGRSLAGSNDGFTGAAPDLGALELGCAPPLFGPRPEGMESVTSAINCR
jgi:hypothetical protein